MLTTILFRGKKRAKPKKNLSHGNLTYSTKGVQKKKKTGKKRALKTKPNYKRLSAVAEHKKCSITNKKNGLKNERAEHERLQGCADDFNCVEEKKNYSNNNNSDIGAPQNVSQKSMQLAAFGKLI